MISELRKCPFCGSNKVYLETPKEDNYYIVCGSCFTEGPCECYEKEAEEAWNKRSNGTCETCKNLMGEER